MDAAEGYGADIDAEIAVLEDILTKARMGKVDEHGHKVLRVVADRKEVRVPHSHFVWPAAFGGTRGPKVAMLTTLAAGACRPLTTRTTARSGERRSASCCAVWGRLHALAHGLLLTAGATRRSWTPHTTRRGTCGGSCPSH